MAAHLDLRRWWTKTSSNFAAGITTPPMIETLQDQYGVLLPIDFKEYILTACPAEDFWDAEHTVWWHFGRIKNVPEEYPHEIRSVTIAEQARRYLFFADYCDWCWAWAISCTYDENWGKIALIGEAPDRFVANSFSDFVQKYLADIRLVC